VATSDSEAALRLALARLENHDDPSVAEALIEIYLSGFSDPSAKLRALQRLQNGLLDDAEAECTLDERRAVDRAGVSYARRSDRHRPYGRR
jgi:hypothetical protein